MRTLVAAAEPAEPARGGWYSSQPVTVGETSCALYWRAPLPGASTTSVVTVSLDGHTLWTSRP